MTIGKQFVLGAIDKKKKGIVAEKLVNLIRLLLEVCNAPNLQLKTISTL